MKQPIASQAAAFESPGLMAHLILGREGNPEVSPLRDPGRCSMLNLQGGARTLFTGPPFSLNLAHSGSPAGHANNPLRRRSVVPGTAPGAEHAGPMVLCGVAEA